MEKYRITLLQKDTNYRIVIFNEPLDTWNYWYKNATNPTQNFSDLLHMKNWRQKCFTLGIPVNEM